MRNGRHPGVRGEETVYSSLTQETMNHRSHHNPESIVLSHIHSTSSENLINHSDSVDGATRVSSRSRMQPTPEAYQIPVSSRENLATAGRMDSVGRFQAGQRHASSTSGYDSTSHLLNRVSSSHPSNSSTDDATNGMNDYEDISGDEAFSQGCDSPDPTSASKMHGRPSVGSTGVYHQLTESRKHSDAPMPATFFVGNSSPQLRGMGSRPAVNSGLTRAPGSNIMPNNARPQRTSETTTAYSSLQQTHRVSNGNRAAGSSSPHIVKEELTPQFQSVDHMARPRAGRESNCSETPPPYTSRRSSEAVSHAESGGSEMIDNAAYGGINQEQRPWYYTSDSSLGSSILQTAPNAREQIQPYAMIHNEHIPYPSHKASDTNLNEFRSNNRPRPEFQVQTPVQPYAEPGRLSITTKV